MPEKEIIKSKENIKSFEKIRDELISCKLFLETNNTYSDEEKNIILDKLNEAIRLNNECIDTINKYKN